MFSVSSLFFLAISVQPCYNPFELPSRLFVFPSLFTEEEMAWIAPKETDRWPLPMIAPKP
jgi:hypothetical protein